MTRKHGKPRLSLRRVITRQKKARQLELLGTSAAGVTGLLVIVIFLAASAQPYTLATRQSAAVVSAKLVELANNDRRAEGVAALAVNPKLVAAAQAKADDMAEKSYFAHVSPDGKDPWHWFAQAGYSFTYAGENLAVDFTDSADVERAWMNSPLHRQNILDAHYTEIGIATAVGEYEGRRTVFVVQAFGTPSVEQEHLAATHIPENPESIATATVLAQAAEERVLGAETKASVAREAPTPTTVENAAVPSDPISYVVASPKQALKYSYYLIGILVLFAFAYLTRFEMKKHHLKHAGAAAGLILLMGLLFVVADLLIFTPPTISDEPAAAQRL